MNTNPMNDLAEDLAGFYYDPVGYAMYAFPWGAPGTPLEKATGLRTWQRKYLENLGRMIRERDFDGITPVAPIQISTASGHGIGKSALTAMIIKFILDTRPFSKGVVTANTGDQLKTKTWAELGKWHNMSVTRGLFEYHATKGNMNIASTTNPETWRCDAMTCREENSEAFAGLHAATATPFYIFDEASAIPEKIFDVAQGGLTDGEPMFFMFGNPTRNTGFFKNTFGVQSHRWENNRIDSRKVEGTNKELFDRWEEDYGEDSDFFRVRVKGIHPRASISQLIDSDSVANARGKHLKPSLYDFAPRILGVDVAWEGDDRSAIFIRQGLASKLLWEKREASSITIAGAIMRFEDKFRTDATFIDAGYGNGVIDQMRHLGRSPIPVWFGGAAIRPDCLNKRAEMWVEMRDWLKLGPAIPDKQELEDDLINVERLQNQKTGQIQLESKKDMKKRGLPSPDLGDALALTFAEPVEAKKEIDKYQRSEPARARTEFDIFENINTRTEKAKTSFDLFA